MRIYRTNLQKWAKVNQVRPLVFDIYGIFRLIILMPVPTNILRVCSFHKSEARGWKKKRKKNKLE
jgi:hypothetical protein